MHRLHHTPREPSPKPSAGLADPHPARPARSPSSSRRVPAVHTLLSHPEEAISPCPPQASSAGLPHSRDRGRAQGVQGSSLNQKPQRDHQSAVGCWLPTRGPFSIHPPSQLWLWGIPRAQVHTGEPSRSTHSGGVWSEHREARTTAGPASGLPPPPGRQRGLPTPRRSPAGQAAGVASWVLGGSPGSPHGPSRKPSCCTKRPEDAASGQAESSPQLREGWGQPCPWPPSRLRQCRGWMAGPSPREAHGRLPQVPRSHRAASSPSPLKPHWCSAGYPPAAAPRLPGAAL